MDEIDGLKKKVRMCERLSTIFLILTAIILVVQYVLAQYYLSEPWARQIVTIFIYSAYVMPILIILPWFFRINYKNKLILTIRRNEKKKG